MATCGAYSDPLFGGSFTSAARHSCSAQRSDEQSSWRDPTLSCTLSTVETLSLSQGAGLTGGPPPSAQRRTRLTCCVLCPLGNPPCVRRARACGRCRAASMCVGCIVAWVALHMWRLPRSQHMCWLHHCMAHSTCGGTCRDTAASPQWRRTPRRKQCHVIGPDVYIVRARAERARRRAGDHP